jgi:hypothetical protein
MSNVICFPGARRPKQSGLGVGLEPSPTAYVPDPRNGEVYATESFERRCENGQEIAAGFVVVHISQSGNSAGMYRGFETLAEAQAAAVRIAREHNAVLS